jgi:hypothetical protein
MKTDTLGKHMLFGSTQEETVSQQATVESVFGKYTRSFGLSLAITSVLSALLVVAKELNGSLLNWMKAATPHHWITHGVFNILLYFVIGVALAQVHAGSGVKVSDKGLIVTIVGSVVISSLIIAGFYLVVG